MDKKKLGLLAVLGLIVLLSACSGQRQAEATQFPVQTTAQTTIVPSATEPPEFPEPSERTARDERAQAASPKAPSLQPWEQISRIQRVSGTITDIDITDGYVQSVDLDVESNVYPPNNPVIYDYVGQNLHLTVMEPLRAAGKLQDKLAVGSVFLVSFAQFAVPPDLNLELAARFENNHFFYQQDGGYIDIKGQPFDLQAEATNP